MARKYRKVGVSGTFDYLHKGHACLIEKAFKVGDSVEIGLTTDEMLKTNPKDHEVSKFNDRRGELFKFLADLGVLERVKIVPLYDLFGPAISDGELDALVVSDETANTGAEINEIRNKKGLKPLKIVVVDLVLADDGFPVSSSRIRRGEIDREGHLFPTP
ncbi:MAG: phosphopantetheine adenylyltransferase [Candidatus Bathyarchaeota archaeon]